MCRSNLDHTALPDPDAGARPAELGSVVRQQLGPEGEQPALGGFHVMDRTTPAKQEWALPAARLAQPQKMRRPINKPAFKAISRHTKVRGGATQILLR